MGDAVQVVLVQVDDKRCGLLAADVVEVLAAVRIAHLPGAPEFIEGIIDLRGTVVAVVDLRARFGLAGRPLLPSDRLVIVEVDERRLALRVDDALDLLTVSADNFDRAVPPFSDAGHVTGLVRLPDGLTVICDPARLLSSEETELLREALADVGLKDASPC